MDIQDLNNRFGYHPADTDHKKIVHSSIRAKLAETADFLNEILENNREKSLAITKLEEAMMWANASFARQFPIEKPVEA